MKKYIKKNRKALSLAFLFSSLAAVFAVKVQFIKGDVLDFALAKSSDKTLIYALYLGLIIVLELVFFYLYDVCKGRFVVHSMKELRSDYFKSILSREYPQFLQEKQGDYLARYTHQMELIENQYFSTLPMLIEILVKIVLVSSFLFILDINLAIVTLVLLTTPLYLPKLVEKALKKAQVDFVSEFEGHLAKVTDWLSGFELIKNFSIVASIREKFEQSNATLMSKNLRKKEMGYLTRSLSALLSYLAHFIILVFAAYLVLKGDFSAGNFFVAVGMIDQLSYPIISVSYFIQDLISIRPVNKSIQEFIDTPSVRTATKEVKIKDFEGIEFERVSFGYKDHEFIFKDLSMKFKKNKRYLLQGMSGSGKTTSMNLLLDYYKMSSGSVKINKFDVSEITNLNQLITVMRQDAILFHDSLRNNIAMYGNVSDEKVIASLKKVALGSYASQDKLDTIISEQGSNFSGGEKRRISLARSLLRERPVIILDEPLANLDDENAKAIESSILEIEDRTIIVISHQFSKVNAAKLDGTFTFS